MAYRPLGRNAQLLQGPTAPRKRFASLEEPESKNSTFSVGSKGSHPLTDVSLNKRLEEYEKKVKDTFDQIVPVLKKISTLQHEKNFLNEAKQLAISRLGFDPKVSK